MPVIEFLGLPASGKTSLARLLCKTEDLLHRDDAWRSQMQQPYPPGAWPLLYTRLIQRICRQKSSLTKRELEFVHANRLLEADNRLRDACYPLICHVAGLLNPERSQDSATIILLQSIIKERVLTAVTDLNQLFYVNDDGLIQRCLSLVGLRTVSLRGEILEHFIHEYLMNVGGVSGIISVDSDIELSIERCRLRPHGRPKLFQSDDLPAFRDRLLRAQAVVQQILNCADQIGIPVLRVDGREPLERTVELCRDLLPAARSR